MSNRTFSITYDTELLQNSSNIDVHIGVSGIRVQFTQLELGINQYNNGNISSQVYLPNLDNVPVSGNFGGYGNIDDGLSEVNFSDGAGPDSRHQSVSGNPRGWGNYSDLEQNDGDVGQVQPVSGNQSVFYNDEEEENYEQVINDISVHNMGDNQENQCSICFNQMSQETLLTTRCNHTFHRQCLAIWERNNNSCPLCRDNLHENNE